jgi:hypothetical protein
LPGSKRLTVASAAIGSRPSPTDCMFTIRNRLSVRRHWHSNRLTSWWSVLNATTSSSRAPVRACQRAMSSAGQLIRRIRGFQSQGGTT